MSNKKSIEIEGLDAATGKVKTLAETLESLNITLDSINESQQEVSNYFKSSTAIIRTFDQQAVAAISTMSTATSAINTNIEAMKKLMAATAEKQAKAEAKAKKEKESDKKHYEELTKSTETGYKTLSQIKNKWGIIDQKQSKENLKKTADFYADQATYLGKYKALVMKEHAEQIKKLQEQEAKEAKELNDAAIKAKLEGDEEIAKLSKDNIKEDIKLNDDATKTKLTADEKVAKLAKDNGKEVAKDSNKMIKLREVQKRQLEEIDIKEQTLTKNTKENAKERADLLSNYLKSVADAMKIYADGAKQMAGDIFASIDVFMKADEEREKRRLDAHVALYDDLITKKKQHEKNILQLDTDLAYHQILQKDNLSEEEKNKNEESIKGLNEKLTSEKALEAKSTADVAGNLKEQERLKKEFEKAESRRKKLANTQKIVQATGDVSMAVINALSVKPFPLGLAMAVIAAAKGASEIAVMTHQYSKLENGGLLQGKRHHEGGMRIAGSNIEVEGGEYVVNRESTQKNIGLVRYINSQRKELTHTDIDTYFASGKNKIAQPVFQRMLETGGELPTITNKVSMDNETLVDAIKNLRIEPKVAVKDILDVHTGMVVVEQWVGK